MNRPDENGRAFIQGRIEVTEAARVYRIARSRGVIPDRDSAVIFHDLGRLAGRLEGLRQLFPATTLHALAVKANPLVGILRRAVEQGAGLEAASFEEVHLALAAGCPPERIVFDSPAKTVEELRFCLSRGVHVNADSVDELARIARVRPTVALPPGSTIGLRINPCVGTGAIAATSVGDCRSRFGVPVVPSEEEVIAAFRAHPWLTGLHVHVGSQGCDLTLLVAGARRAFALRRAINAALGQNSIGLVDIGGGVPAQYSSAPVPFTLEEYASELRREIPEFDDPAVRVVTEFGRSILAGCGFAVARVEYVKSVGSKPLAVVHLGADFLLRPVYQPDHWRHEFAVLDAEGRPKAGLAARPWTVAGPLCFAGDLLAQDVLLPEMEPGDLVLIRDVGAYTLGLWSRHCSRGIPLVLGYQCRLLKDAGDEGSSPRSSPSHPDDDRDLDLTVLRARERPEDVVRFWS